MVGGHLAIRQTAPLTPLQALRALLWRGPWFLGVILRSPEKYSIADVLKRSMFRMISFQNEF